MANSRAAYSLLFVAFAALVLVLPGRWTGTARTTACGLLGPISHLASTLLLLGDAGAGAGGGGGAGNGAGEGQAAAALRAENAELRAALLAAQAENLDLRRKLSALVQLSEAGFPAVPVILPAALLPAQDTSNWHRTLLLDRGTTGGIEIGQPVVWGRSLIGKVVEAGPGSARVRLLTDPAFRMKALLVPDGPAAGGGGGGAGTPGGAAGASPETVSGLLEGVGPDECEVAWVLRDVAVRPGWIVVTMEEESGLWPKGLVAGRVREVSNDYGSYLRIKVRPEADPSALDGAFVLKLPRR
ncbi:MAG: hypothetical protein HZA54_08965 [Planctomycetes bacterium]|nr:hypothetical protein [Planctomycetota bacterium]